MFRGLAGLVLAASASPVLADPAPSDVQSLNAAVFVQRPPVTARALPFQGSFRPVIGASDGRVGASTRVNLWSAAGVRQRLEAMGVKDGDKAYHGEGRFYLFAAVHGQAVGLNLQGQGGGLQRRGWSTDTTSTLVGDGQVGFGWRKGGFEADMGYVHRSVHLIHAPLGGTDGYADDAAALSFTLRPRR